MSVYASTKVYLKSTYSINRELLTHALSSLLSPVQKLLPTLSCRHFCNLDVAFGNLHDTRRNSSICRLMQRHTRSRTWNPMFRNQCVWV